MEALLNALTFVLTACWVIYNARIIWRLYLAANTPSDERIKVRCQRCGTTYDVSREEYGRLQMVKETKVTKGVQTPIGGGSVGVPTSQAKRYLCPTCGTKEWADTVELERYATEAQGKARPIFRQVVICAVGLSAISLVVALLGKLLGVS